jgi:hypothetical protein
MLEEGLHCLYYSSIRTNYFALGYLPRCMNVDDNAIIQALLDFTF